MYTPTFNYSDKVVQNLVKIEKSKTILENLDLSYAVRFKLLQTNKAYEILHFTKGLGIEITLNDAEKIVESKKVDVGDETRSIIIRNFKNALDFNRSNVADTYSEFDRPVLLHLANLLLNQWKETWEANFRSFHEKMDERWDNYAPLRNTQINVNEIESEMYELIEWYKYSTPTITPVVRIAITFFRLIELTPFTAGNKFIILAILDYLLLKNGLSSKSYTSFMRMLSNSEEKLLKGHEIVQKTYDLSHWVDIFTSMISSDLIQSREEIHEFIAQEEKSKQQPFLNLNKRQLKILKYLQNVPAIQREDYCHMMEVSTMTAFRDLNDLVRKKLIKLEGKGRGTRYKLASMG